MFPPYLANYLDHSYWINLYLFCFSSFTAIKLVWSLYMLIHFKLTLRDIIEWTSYCMSTWNPCILLEFLFNVSEILTPIIYHTSCQIMWSAFSGISRCQTHLMSLIKHFLTLFLSHINLLLRSTNSWQTNRRNVTLSRFMSILVGRVTLDFGVSPIYFITVQRLYRHIGVFSWCY